jgi:hypothetical protein
MLALTTELGKSADLLSAELAQLPCWSVPGRCAYKTSYGGANLAIQLASPLWSRSSLDDFAAWLREVVPDDANAVARPAVLRQFEEWILTTDAPSRERGFLEVLSEMRTSTAADYPELLPEFCTERVLCWTWVEGEPLPASLPDASADIRQRLAEAILEQISFLAFADGELDPEAIAVSPEGRIIFRRISRPLAVPVGRTQAVIRYLADMLSENSMGAARWLLELAGQSRSGQSVSQLLAAMAVVQSQVIRREITTPFVRAFEGNWRAMHSTGMEIPLYLSVLHRNLIAAGTWSAARDSASPGNGPDDDLMPEAQAAVLGGMLRHAVENALEPAQAREWAAGLGMIALEGVRLLGRIAGNLRDVRISQQEDAPPRDATAEFRTRCLRQGVLSAVLLIVFLVCLRASQSTSPPWPMLLSLLAAISALALFWSVSRIG